MKKILIIASILSMVIFSSCNEGGKISSSDVPQAVVAAFNTKYPDATGTEWKTEKDDGRLVYEAEFKSGGKDIEAEFYENGTFNKEH